MLALFCSAFAVASLLPLSAQAGWFHFLFHHHAKKKRLLCTFSLDGDKEAKTIRKMLSKETGDNYQRIELSPQIPQKDIPGNWFDIECARTDLHCDAVVISGHFNGGFFGQSGKSLPLSELEKNSCENQADRNHCAGILTDPKHVFLVDPLYAEAKPLDQEARRMMLRNLKGMDPKTAKRVADLKNMTLDHGGMDRLTQLFPNAKITSFREDTENPVSLDKRIKDEFKSGALTVANQASRSFDPNTIVRALPGNDPDSSCNGTCQNLSQTKIPADHALACQFYGKGSKAEKLKQYRTFLADPTYNATARLPVIDEFLDAGVAGSVRAIRDPCNGIPDKSIVGPIQVDGKWACKDPDRQLFGDPAKADACCLLKGTTFAEKHELALKKAPLALREKEAKNIDQVIVKNWASSAQNAAQPLRDSQGHPIMRFSTWNIARGANFKRLKEAMGDCAGYMRTGTKKIKNRKKWANAYREACDLEGTDVFELQEVDMDVCRSGYRNVAEELAKANGLNYVWTGEFDEVDNRKIGLGHDTEYPQCDHPDESRSKNLIGNAILSRYPILSAKRIPLHDCYHWDLEAKRRSVMEFGKEEGEMLAFREKDANTTQVRTGGRNALLATLQTPDGPVTVLSAHLENRTTPQCRQIQLKQIAQVLRTIKTPVVLAGDFNTTGMDGRRITYAREILGQLKPKNLAKQAFNHFVNPYSTFTSPALGVLNIIRKNKHPFSPNIPFFMENKEAGMAKIMRNRIHCQDLNSTNLPGYTSETDRHFGPFGQLTLDWNCIVPNGDSHFIGLNPQLDGDLNHASRESPSDHYARTIDIPIR